MKFGGALMENASGIVKVSKLIEEFSCEPLIVVVSALGKTTNALEKLYHKYLGGESMEEGFFEIKKNHISVTLDLFSTMDDELSSNLDKLFEQLLDALNTEYSNRYEAYDCIVSFGEELSSCIIFHFLKKLKISSRLISLCLGKKKRSNSL